jgi:hypothetical protein
MKNVRGPMCECGNQVTLEEDSYKTTQNKSNNSLDSRICKHLLQTNWQVSSKKVFLNMHFTKDIGHKLMKSIQPPLVNYSLCYKYYSIKLTA